MNVLLTNDDGIRATGLRALYNALLEKGHQVTAVAPMRQQSAVGHALTAFEPLRIETITEPGFSGIGVHGTPTDCVKLALDQLLPQKPDIVISGINLGRNVGPDIFYSGTVGAAAESAHSAIPSLAVSHADREGSPEIFEVGRHAIDIAEKIAEEQLLPGSVINLNYPSCPLKEAKGPKLCIQAPAKWSDAYTKRIDPRGKPYWWLTGDMDKNTIPPDSDLDLLYKGYITLTPLKIEYNHEEGLEILQHSGIFN